MPQIGDWRYFVEYLDYAKGVAIMKAAGADPEYDGLWDYCDQGEITTRKEFPTKAKAVAWAQRHKKLDVFHMPRIEEETFDGRQWQQTGYWETDGQTEIYLDAA